MRIRPAGPEDAVAMVAVLARGFEAYRAFLPPGWVPPERLEPENVERARSWLAEPATWARLAEEDGVVAAIVAFGSAPDGPDSLAHLRWLFVEPPWWGTGLAATLLHAAEEAAAAAGYAAMRLLTPAGQARARRFYAREGYAEDGPPRPDDRFGGPIVTLRKSLPA